MSFLLTISLGANEPKHSLQGNSESSRKNLIERYFKNSMNLKNQEEFFDMFATLVPSGRVELWLKDESGNPKVESKIRDVMIISGLDCIPCLMDLCRGTKKEDRALSIHLLSLMDRFVPMKNAPLKLPFGTVRDYSRHDSRERGWNGGVLDRFMQLDGRRIGADAKELLYRIAEQETDQDLRAFAREEVGLLYSDLKQISLPELVNRWRNLILYLDAASIKKNPASFGAASQLQQIRRVMMDSALELIPIMRDIMINNNNAAVRDAAYSFLLALDAKGVRMRRLQEGQKAIREMRQALVERRLRPENQTQNAQFYKWQALVAQVFDDETPISDFMFSPDYSRI